MSNDSLWELCRERNERQRRAAPMGTFEGLDAGSQEPGSVDQYRKPAKRRPEPSAGPHWSVWAILAGVLFIVVHLVYLDVKMYQFSEKMAEADRQLKAMPPFPMPPLRK